MTRCRSRIRFPGCSFLSGLDSCRMSYLTTYLSDGDFILKTKVNSVYLPAAHCEVADIKLWDLIAVTLPLQTNLRIGVALQVSRKTSFIPDFLGPGQHDVTTDRCNQETKIFCGAVG